ncbi:hypothetical protein [Streptomyces sp. NBC_00009]|uniref:hypothetical protein n=1 Tax=Streptomyces sp. NBC_00009 TaxID=2975620 RepID=UPI003244BDEC
MSTNPTPSTLAVAVICAGSLLMMGATACLLALHEPAWRGVVLAGAVIHTAGLLLHRRNRPATTPAVSDEDADDECESFAWEHGDLRDGGEANR